MYINFKKNITELIRTSIPRKIVPAVTTTVKMVTPPKRCTDLIGIISHRKALACQL